MPTIDVLYEIEDDRIVILRAPVPCAGNVGRLGMTAQAYVAVKPGARRGMVGIQHSERTP